MDNPFEMLGVPQSFALDPRLLERRQRELGRALHPDRHAGASPAARRQALSRAMDVNRAFRTLRDPLSRAAALLSVMGAALDTETERVTDPVLLGRMLDERERLDEVRRLGDRAALGELKARMQEREQELYRQLEVAFAPLERAAPARAGGDGAASADDTAYARVCELLTELRYVRRYLEQVAALEDEVG